MKHNTNILQNDIRRGACAFLALGSLLALTLFASGCKNYHLDDEDASRAGTGSVTVSLSDGKGSRLVMPSAPATMTIARYDITCSRAGNESKIASGLTDANALTVNELAEGEWTLTIDAYDASGNKVATGSSNVTIVAGKTAAASVVLSPLFPRTAGGQGTVSITFACSDFQAYSNDWQIELTPVTGGSKVSYNYETSQGVTVDQVKNTISIYATLDSGDWDLSFTLKTDSDSLVSASDVVKVYDGLTSVSATGGPIPISAKDFFRADRVLYVSNTAEAGRIGKTPAQACTLVEAIAKFNERNDLTEANPGVIILTENVVYSPSNQHDILMITKPMKIMSLASAATPYSISANQAVDNMLCVCAQSSDIVSLTLERVAVQPGGAWGIPDGLLYVTSGSSVAKLTLNAGATVKGNAFDEPVVGGVHISGGTLVMNEGSEISGNTSLNGGGVYSSGTADEIVMNGGTISGNTALTSGGGIYTGAATAKVTLAGGAITNNTAYDGAITGLGAGVCLMGENVGGLSVTAPGGWKAVVSGNHGIGPDLVRQVLINGMPGFQTILTSPHDYPVWVNGFTSISLDISSPGGLSLSNGSEIVLSGSNVTYSASAAIPSSFITITNGTLWVNVPVLTTATSASSLFTVSGGKLVLAESAKLVGKGNSGTRGGAIYVSGGSVEMRGGSIESCTALHGGGVYVVSGGKFYLYDGIISGNNADQYGGGIYVTSGGSLYVNNHQNRLAGKVKNNTGTVQGLKVDSGCSVFYSAEASPTSWTSLTSTKLGSYPDFTGIFYNNDIAIP